MRRRQPPSDHAPITCGVGAGPTPRDDVPMRSVPDLPDLPYTFWQLRLLTEDQFRRRRKIASSFSERQPGGLHRLRVLTPFLRVSRDGRGDRSGGEAEGPRHLGARSLAADLSHRSPSGLARRGRLSRSFDRAFHARRRLRWKQERSPTTPVTTHSHHQLQSCPWCAAPLPHLRYSQGGEVDGFEVYHRMISGSWRSQVEWLHQRLIATTALIYYPNIIAASATTPTSLITTTCGATIPSPTMLDWLEVEPSWIKDSAGVSDQADGIDPPAMV